ncbi:HEAT repeat domain-containing protein [Nocardia sp. NPDC058666]|uniref:HEAT repeat domain-containing protein n=1 Tax=Nocardia sp. NPDC058666 TaxID=3346587 RepID=UPI003658722D
MSVVGEYGRIAQQQDRSATFELIRVLSDPAVSAADRDELGDVLGRLGDVRAAAPLAAIGLDRDRPAEVRQVALRVLENSAMCPEGARWRAWWNAGDDLVRGCLLRQAERTEADLLEPVARDPHHPLHRHALTGIEFGFEEPRWQQYKIQGLDHPDPGVRRTAAEVLYWEEPVAAEQALHRTADDRDTGVACAAIETLRCYHSRATLRLLHELAQGDDERADAARDSQDDLLGSFQCEQRSILGWLAPVADLLGPPEFDAATSGDASVPDTRELIVPVAAQIFSTYSDPDGAWAPKLDALHSYHWIGVPTADRVGLATFLSGHPDPQVRASSCRALSTWHEVDLLLALAHDPDVSVRKSAVYYLRFVPRSHEIATLSWDLVDSGEVAGTRGYEALATCAAHTPPGELDDRLIELARTDFRESIRAEAVSQLAHRIEPVLPVLTESPLVTWAVHIRILSACREQGLRPPGIGALRDVDNLDLAVALAGFDDVSGAHQSL